MHLHLALLVPPRIFLNETNVFFFLPALYETSVNNAGETLSSFSFQLYFLAMLALY